MPRLAVALGRSLAVVSAVAGVVVAGDLLARDVLVRWLPAPGMHRGIGLEPVITLLRADHAGVSVLAQPVVAALAAGALAVAVLVLVPLLVREFAPTGHAAAVGTGLFAGGLLANQRSLAVHGSVLDAIGFRLPGGTLLVTGVADLAAVAGISLVAVLTGAAVLAVLPSFAVTGARTTRRVAIRGSEPVRR